MAMYCADNGPHRRTWFLERVLKLGLTQIAKEYQCVRVKSLLPVSAAFIRSIVFYMSRLTDMCTTPRGEVETSISSCLSLR